MLETILLVIFLLVGLTGFLWTIYSMFLSFRARRWPIAQGTIESANYFGGVNSDRNQFYTAEVDYKYNVDGSTFISNKVGYGMYKSTWAWDFSKAFTEATKDYPDVKVHYNPNNPGDSVLLVGLRRYHISGLIFWAFLFGMVFYHEVVIKYIGV